MCLVYVYMFVLMVFDHLRLSSVGVVQVTTRFCTDCVNYRGQSALELAAGADNVPMVQLLLHLGASQRSIGCALTCACLVGSIAVVSILLDAKPVAEGH